MTTQASPISLTVEVVRKGDDCVVVNCRGRLVSGVCSFFYNKVHDLIPGRKQVVLDLTGLDHVDSMGLGALVRLQVIAKKNGRQLQLMNVGKRVRDLLELTNLLFVFGEIGETAPDSSEMG